MDTTASERALRRVLTYLRQSDVAITPATEREALILIAQVFDSEPDDPMDECLKQVIHRLGKKHEALPQISPPLHRTSLGYGEF